VIIGGTRYSILKGNAYDVYGVIIMTSYFEVIRQRSLQQSKDFEQKINLVFLTNTNLLSVFP
jgi:hypothetical protein